MANSAKGKDVGSGETSGIPGVKSSLPVGELEASIGDPVCRGSESEASSNQEEGSGASNNLKQKNMLSRMVLGKKMRHFLILNALHILTKLVDEPM